MSQDLKITSVVVVYNKKIESSITLHNMQKINCVNNRLLIIDNSEKDFGNKKYCQEKGIDYISMHGNKGLSKAYNKAVDNSQDSDIIVLFDDDTNITEKYFLVLLEAAKKNPDVDIFAPVIYGQDGVIYSPNESNFMKNHLISSPEQHVSQELFNAIASCLAIRMRVFDNYRFNEKLFIDQVDQNFFDEQRERHAKFMKLNVIVKQNFYQRGEDLTAKSGWARLRLRIVDIIRHARLKKQKKYVFLGFVKCCGLGVQIGIKTRSPRLFINAVCLTIKSVLF